MLFAQAPRGGGRAGGMPTIIDSGDDEAAWLRARQTGISASMIPKAMTPGGRATFVQDYLAPAEDAGWFEQYREHGHRREREFLGAWIADAFGMQHNTALWASDANPRHLATPDGIKIGPEGFPALYELKTSTKPMPRTTPRHYRDQMQFQMYVMGAPRCLLVWEQHEDFRPVGLPEWRWVERDDARITELVRVADALLWEIDTAREEQA